MRPKRRTLFMETTQVDPSQTVGEIQRILGQYGASAIMTEYDEEREVSAVSFEIKLQDHRIPFRLPCRWGSIFEVLNARRKRRPYKRSVEAQAKRVAWRQILRWVEAQLALVETDMVKMQEVFLPYILQKDDKTLYEYLEERNFKAIEYKK
jgi:hypothetical protein